MSLLLRFLGLEKKDRNAAAAGGEATQHIAEQLAGLEPERARFFAAFAYVLTRVAGADLRVEECELAEMRRTLVRVAGIDEPEAELVVEMASTQADRLGATDDYLVTRDFRRIASREERVQLLECLFSVAAADETITGDESAAIMNVAQELGLGRDEVIAIRARYRDKLAEFRRLRGETQP